MVYIFYNCFPTSWLRTITRSIRLVCFPFSTLRLRTLAFVIASLSLFFMRPFTLKRIMLQRISRWKLRRTLLAGSRHSKLIYLASKPPSRLHSPTFFPLICLHTTPQATLCLLQWEKTLKTATLRFRCEQMPETAACSERRTHERTLLPYVLSRIRRHRR
jgi:hypothetical protein